MKSLLSRVGALTLCVLPSLCWAWGYAGHRRLAANLQAPFPQGACLREWIASHQSASFQDDATDPDRWRTNDSSEWPRHFLEIDWVDPIWNYPRDWAQAQAEFGSYALRNGQVPWRVEEYYGRLVQNFRDKSSAGALTTLAHLSHYVTDAFSPLHDTKRFDPKLNLDDAVGLHQRYESDMLEVKANLDGLTQKMAQYYGTLGRASPKDDTFLVVISGNGLVQGLIDADQAAQGALTGLYARTSDMTARRFGDALTLMASLVGTAWLEAGSPTLSGMSATCAKAVAQGPVLLKGYPWPEAPVAALPDGGVLPGGTETDGGAASLPDGRGNQAEPQSPSGCSAVPAVLGALPLGLWVLGRKRRDRSAAR